MSNSIWKTPDQKPEENKLIFAQHDRQRDGNIDYFIWDIHEFRDAIRKDSIRWCYLDELLAQADKAERLQKAVDLAVHTLNEICAGVPSDIWVFDEATKATNEIKQLMTSKLKCPYCLADSESRQITYMTDGRTKVYYGRNGTQIETNLPLPVGFVITIKETTNDK